MKKFINKIVFITGSSRGIGKAIALAFAKNGAIVILHASKKSNQAITTFRQIKKFSSKCQIYYFKIENYQEVVKQTRKIIKKYKQIDILVNNAGITRDKTLLKMTHEEWNEVINVNLNGVFNITKNMLENIRDNGRIINTSSVIGQLGAFGQTNYAASKAGIIGFTKSLALELAKRNITVNAICPGFTKTDMTNNIPKEIINSKILPRIPLKRMAETNEIASLVLYLSSSDAGYITGQYININGGLI